MASLVSSFDCLRIPGRIEVQKRLAEAAPNAHRYAAALGVAICSYGTFTSGFLGGAAIAISPLLIGGGVVWYLRHSANLVARESSQPERVQKINFVAQVILGSALLLAGIGCGAAAGYFVGGVRLLVVAVQSANPLGICRGIAQILFTLGYSLPALKYLLGNPSSLYSQYESLVRSFSISVVHGILFLLGMLGFFGNNRTDIDTFISIIAALPEETLLDHFFSYVPTLSDEDVCKVIEHLPNILTVDVLARRLPQERFENLVLPRLLEAPLNEDELRAIPEQIARLKNEASLLQKGALDLEEEVERISKELTQHQQNLLKFRGFLNGLPKQPLPDVYQDLDERLQEFALLAEGLEAIEKLVQNENSQLRPRLQALRLSRAVEEENDPEEPNYEVLGAIGFYEPEFKMLGEKLGIPSEELKGHEIQRTCEELEKEKYGLAMRKDLEKNDLLKQPYTIEEVIDRIAQYCKKKSKRSFGKSITPVIQTVFNRSLFYILSTVQIVSSPVTTTLGFAYNMMSTRRSLNQWILRYTSWINMNALYSPSTEFSFDRGVQANIRSLYWRVGSVVWSSLPLIGGFFAGMRYAELLRPHFGMLQQSSS